MKFILSVKGSIVRALSERNYEAVVGFLEEESGQNQIEFALICALLGLSAMAALRSFAADVQWLWAGLSNNLASSI